MAKIAYRGQQQNQQSPEGDAADSSLDAAGQALHRAASVPKAIRQQMVYQKQESSKQAYPQEKPVTVDYMVFSDEEPVSEPLQHQPLQSYITQVDIQSSSVISPKRATDLTLARKHEPAIRYLQAKLIRKRLTPKTQTTAQYVDDLFDKPEQRKNNEKKESAQKQKKDQSKARTEVVEDHSAEAQSESKQSKQEKPLQQQTPTQNKSNHSRRSTVQTANPSTTGDHAPNKPISEASASKAALPANSSVNGESKETHPKAAKRAPHKRTRAGKSVGRRTRSNNPAAMKIRTSDSVSPKTALRTQVHNTSAKGSEKLFFQKIQQTIAVRTVAVRKAVKKHAVAILKATVKIAIKSVVRILGAILGAVGGILGPLIVILLTGAILCSPLGLFFTGEAENEMTLQQAMTQINTEFSDKITEIENSVPHDDMRQTGHRAFWKDILTVYAVKATTGTEDPMDVVTMDDAHFEVLRTIFWYMNAISYATEAYTETESVEVQVEGEDGEKHTETQIQTVEKTRLIVQIDGKDAADMAIEYGFTPEQIRMVRELLSDEYAEFWSLMAVPGVGSNDIVEVALAQVGNVGGQPYWSWYGFPYRVAWCACFVSWCADQCGYLDAGIIPRHSLVDDGIYWFRARGQWQDRYYLPSPGDIIYFDWEPDGSPDHVGIVESCDGFYVYTIEGNSGDVCRQLAYAVGSSCIFGYGTLIIR